MPAAKADGNQIPGGIAGVAAAEAQKRQEQVTAAQTLFTAGSKAYSDQSYAEAMDYFKAAFETIPDVPAVADQRRIFFKRYQAAAYRYAVVLAEEAKWGESEQTLADVVNLAESSKMERSAIDPEIREMLEDLRNRDERFDMAATPQHLRNVDTVKSKLTLGQGYLGLGDYDRAERSFNEALATDPFNTAARRGLEEVERHRWNYYDAATDHTRAKALAAVAGSWESPVRVPSSETNLSINMDGVSEAGSAALERKLKEIIIPQMDLENARLAEVVEFLSQKAQELDASESDPRRRGVNIVIDSSGLPEGEDAGQRVLTVKLSNIPLGVALKYAAQQVGMVYRTDNFAVRVISESSDDGGVLLSRRYIVPPGFLSGDGGTSSAAGPVDPFAAPEPDGGAGAPVERISPQQFLEDRGVVFGPGASANFIAASNSLIVRNTSQQLVTIDSIVQAARDTVPKNVEVRVKIVSIESETLKLLGMDHLLGQSRFNNGALAYSGGTNGNAADPLIQADYPFVDGVQPLGLNPITSGLRMGALGSNTSIEDVINNGIGGGTGAGGRAPGVFAVAGVLTNPQFQTVIRALDQAKGSDFLCDAYVAVKPGQLAKIEVIREFIYPTEYDPPEFNNPPPVTVEDEDETDVDVDPNDTRVVSPAHPTAYESRNLGKTLQVEPTVAADNKTVSVNIILDFTDFIGFINYGVPISIADGLVTTQVSENPILMAVFDSIKETTNVTVWDGQTIVIGGLHGESVTGVQDKVPFLGDLPVLGRAFGSKTNISAKRAITIFLTVNLIDPGGSPINLPVEETTEFTPGPRFNPSGGLQSGPPPALPFPAK